MKTLKGKNIDIDLLEAVEEWVEKEDLFRGCWSADTLIEERTKVYSFEPPDPLEFGLLMSFPFESDADGETYEDIYSFARSVFESIQEGIALEEWGERPSLKWDVYLRVEKSHHFKSKHDRYAINDSEEYILIIGVDSI